MRGIHRWPVNSRLKRPVVTDIYSVGIYIHSEDSNQSVTVTPECHNTENWELSWWQLCHHCRHRRLSLWQLKVPPDDIVGTKSSFVFLCTMFCNGFLEISRNDHKRLRLSRYYVNSPWPSSAIWWHRTGTVLAQVMACCLTAPLPGPILTSHW